MLRNDNEPSLLSCVVGPYCEEKITSDKVYQAFVEVKQLWDKEGGRMCTHSIISWHKDDIIHPEEALNFSKEFAQKHFRGFQTLLVVHEDKDHLHVHFVTNSVSYVNGKKLHETKSDLYRMRQLTNHMCEERGLNVPEKGKDFEGNLLPEGKSSIWNQNKYHAARDKDAFLMKCFKSVVDAKKTAHSKDEFICLMKKEGWDVLWDEKRKHIVFQNKDGKKVRDSNLAKTYNIAIDKTSLLEQFNQNKFGNNVSDSNFENYIIADTRKNIHKQKKYKTRLNDYCIEERSFSGRDREIER